MKLGPSCCWDCQRSPALTITAICPWFSRDTAAALSQGSAKTKNYGLNCPELGVSQTVYFVLAKRA